MLLMLWIKLLPEKFANTYIIGITRLLCGGVENKDRLNIKCKQILFALKYTSY